jgi:hypothetical protein
LTEKTVSLEEFNKLFEKENKEGKESKSTKESKSKKK